MFHFDEWLKAFYLAEFRSCWWRMDMPVKFITVRLLRASICPWPHFTNSLGVRLFKFCKIICWSSEKITIRSGHNFCTWHDSWTVVTCAKSWPGGRFKNTYELLNLRALKFSPVNKIHIFQCIGKIFCVEFQRYPLKFHPKYLTHTLKDMIFI